MFKVEKNNEKVGQYLANLIDNKYESRRAFCREYISLSGREDEELTQKQVADMMGISQSYISRLEKRIMKRLRSEVEKLYNR